MNETRPPVAPGRYPVLGHTFSFLRAPLETLERWGESDRDVLRASVAGKRVHLVTDPAAVGEVLVTDNQAYRKAEVVRERLGTLQGGSLVLLEGEEWRERRQHLQPAFAPDRVTSMASAATEYATNSVSSWPAAEPFRADEWARDLSLRILARTLFGLDLGDGGTPIHDAADDIMARMDLGSVSTYLPEWVPTRTNRRFRRAVGTLHERLDERVARRSAADESGSDLLSTMLAAGLPQDRIRDELIAFLFAGFDSTATALSCTIGLLGGHPEVQSTLRRELDTTFEGETPEPTALDTVPTSTPSFGRVCDSIPLSTSSFGSPRRRSTSGASGSNRERLWSCHRGSCIATVDSGTSRTPSDRTDGWKTRN